jgi:integrative and conjugative element protein (TIGR02256 family)
MSRIAWVDKRLLGLMSAESECWCPKETGGILVGYWSDRDVVITDIIGPGPKAVHRRYSFTPDAKWQENEIARTYEESGRVITYLGDWHSHPHGTPGLSIKDLVTLLRVAIHKPARAPRPIMGILHNNPQWELMVWRFAFSKIVSGPPTVAMKVTWFDG